MKFRLPIVRAAATAAVLAPFVLSVAAHSVRDDHAKVEAADRPALAFREYLLHLGRIPEGKAVPGRFWFINNGDKPLTILGFEPSCGCLTPQLDKKTYAPGEQGTFLVRADTAGESYNESAGDASGNAGQLKQHFVDVRYDAGDGEQMARVHLKFVLPPRRIIVEPRSLLIHQFGNGSATGDLSHTITVTDRRSLPAHVLAVESSSDKLNLETQLAEGRNDPTRAVINVTLPDATVGELAIRIVIRTDDPDQPRIEVPIVIQVHDRIRVGANPLELVPKETVRK